MIKKRKWRGKPIHRSIKKRLGYDLAESDDDIVSDWKERTSRICKPCWELKYCPYGPFVEQSPILPPTRDGMVRQQAYFKNCLSTDTVGEVTQLSDEMKELYRCWISDENILNLQAITEINNKKRIDAAGRAANPEDQIEKWIDGELPPIEIYRIPYDLGMDKDIEESDYEPEVWLEIKRVVEKNRKKFSHALEVGFIDNRSPLEPARRSFFERQVQNFDSDDYPNEIPRIFLEAECSIFGHICPVFFVSEAMTETKEERRIGRRNLSFSTMMRIVRRDDYIFQECGKKLKDNEVEFDHIIPISKGGSSEEHNIRLACYDCNRDKSDIYDP